jgi:protein-tyrosine phosphatase
LGVPISAVEFDYHLTDSALQHEREEREAEFREVGLPAEFASTAKGMIRGIQDHLDSKYGSLEHYLDGIGFTKADRQLVRDNLLY